MLAAAAAATAYDMNFIFPPRAISYRTHRAMRVPSPPRLPSHAESGEEQERGPVRIAAVKVAISVAAGGLDRPGANQQALHPVMGDAFVQMPEGLATPGCESNSQLG